jgi:hypothetical protein
MESLALGENRLDGPLTGLQTLTRLTELEMGANALSGPVVLQSRRVVCICLRIG